MILLLSLLSLSLSSSLARKRFIFSSLITWQQLMILSRNLQDMITGVPLDDLSTSLHLVELNLTYSGPNIIMVILTE